MRIISSSCSANRRPGVVLLVVMAMLALFASVALAFVFYADGLAVASQLGRQSIVRDQAGVDPQVLADYFLGQMLYGTSNPNSALRGWDLARSIYGYNPTDLNYTPYNGIGRSALMQTLPFSSPAENFYLFNYQKFTPNALAWSNTTNYSIGNFVTSGGKVYACYQANVNKDPSTSPLFWSPGAMPWSNTTNYPAGAYVNSGGNVYTCNVLNINRDPATNPLIWQLDPLYNAERTPEFYGKLGDANYRYVGGANPPWTAYDSNNLFLAQVAADGTVLMPSFYRPWNSTVLDIRGRYQGLKPHPTWNPLFVTPDSDGGGDVKNLEFGPGVPNGAGGYFNNDSMWIDMGFPVLTAPNGKRYKPLVAPLIMDLSNRLHLWAHGNRLGTGGAHVSNRGNGPTEVNLAHLPGIDAAELQTLFDLKYGGTYYGTLTNWNASTQKTLPNWTYGGATGATLSLPGVTQFTIASASQTGCLVTITTTAAHGFAVGHSVGINGVSVAGYNGVFTVYAAPSTTTFQYTVPATGLAVGAGGTTWRVPNVRGGPWYANIDADGLNASGGSSYPFLTGFALKSLNAIPMAGADITVTPTVDGVTATLIGTTSAGFPWAIVPGTMLGIDSGTDYETITVKTVNTGANTFTADITKAHLANVPLMYATLFPFPTFPSGWDNAIAAELTQKPLGFDLRNPVSPNLAPLPMSHMEALLRHRGSLSPSIPSELFRRMPKTFSNPKARQMVTMVNHHLDRISAQPVIQWDSSTPGRYQLAAGTAYPKLTGVIPPLDYSTPGVFPAKSDFTTDWRSNVGKLLRVNLNRPLADYPLPTFAPSLAEPNSKQIDTSVATTLAAYNLAVSDRQAFAKDIYQALIKVTGAQDPNVALIAFDPLDFTAARWLAQLAVNIVDYIDNDDYHTPFAWYGTEYVFGTELPRLVLNEGYAQLDNDLNAMNAMGTMATGYRLNVWAELHNPLTTTTAGSNFPLDNGSAKLKIGSDAVYQVLVCKSSAALNTLMRNPDNVLGDPDMPSILATVSDWGTTATQHELLPASGAFSGQVGTSKKDIAAAPGGATWAGDVVTITTTAAHGFTVGQSVKIENVTDVGYNGTYTITAVPSTTTFKYTSSSPMALAASGAGTATAAIGGNSGFYVVGPTPSYIRGPGVDPALTTTTALASLSIAAPLTTAPTDKLTLILRRLAVPHLPANPLVAGVPANPMLPLNPYVTVDYVEDMGLKDGRLFDGTGPFAGGTGMALRKSVGRKHPYAAHTSQVVAQTARISMGQDPSLEPIHTFFSHNGTTAATLDSPFAWLTHLDRPLVNQLELLHVSAYKPHELTQQFITTAGKFQHYAPWGLQGMPWTGADPSAAIFRSLDLLTTPTPMFGAVRGGRGYGNININTLMEGEVFKAICDPQDATQPYYAFSQAEVAAIAGKIVKSRNGGSPANLPPDDNTQRPFKGFAAGNLDDTFLRRDPDNPADLLFAVGAPTNHPYSRASLLQKIHNNITTTSNVFAVWWTVGYFEVVDESVSPPRLGQEIGRADNRHIRHRFFAIVDRSGMQLFSALGNAVPVAGKEYQVTLSGLPATTNAGVPMSIQPGMLLEVGTGSATEVVAAKDASPWVASTMMSPQVYAVNALVSFNGRVYRCTVPHTSAAANAPPNTSFWASDSFTADFTIAPTANSPVICRGNPGPQTNYTARKDIAVVLHFSVIQ